MGVTIKGLEDQRVYIEEYEDTDAGFGDGYNVFIGTYMKPAGPQLGTYVNREKFLRKIAKFFNVVIYDVGYEYEVHDSGYGDAMIVTEARHGYNKKED